MTRAPRTLLLTLVLSASGPAHDVPLARLEDGVDLDALERWMTGRGPAVSGRLHRGRACS